MLAFIGKVVLRHTFVHLPGVGPRTERRLWLEGITTWEEALSHPLPFLAHWQREWLWQGLDESLWQLERGNALFFAQRLPPGERWRLMADFIHKAACLDIETTGLSAGYAYITVIGLYDGCRYQAFVRGANLERFLEEIGRFRLVITYNGLRFDIPFIEVEMGPVLAGLAHVDIMYPLRRLGYRGGLKRVEEELGVARPGGLQGLQGYDAVRLWHLHQQGHQGALPTLIRYNAEDVVALWPLAALVYNAMAAQLPVPVTPMAVPSRPWLDLPYDPELVEWLLALKIVNAP
jgi:uncharacterized protein